MRKGLLIQNIREALRSVRSQLLRTILTSLIIAIGITALVGILTAIDSIKVALTGQFALLGANTFTIQNRGPNIQIGRDGKRPKVYQNITYYEALEFKERFAEQPALVSISYMASGTAEVKHRNLKTDPNITVWAMDENYIKTGGYEIEEGRNLTEAEIENAYPVAMVGQEIKKKLFPNSSPLGKTIEIGNKRYRVTGLMKPKGNAFGFGGDKSVFIPVSNARSIFSTPNQSFAINVMALNSETLDQMTSESTALMRKVRRLKPKQENDFHITKSDNLSQTLIENLSYVTYAAIIIGVITLVGAAIALMNIMLVSVTERTREIGVRKAIGAKAFTIRNQFLTEAIAICLIGGLGGIVFGITIGNLTSLFIGGTFIVPWDWISLAIGICFVVGLISGIYPAYKASVLDPIESLRHE